MLANTLRDDDSYEDLANRSLDTAYVAPLLNWGDIFSYPLSFSDPKEALKANIAVAFPAASLKSDVIGFIKAPVKRVTKAVSWRTEYPIWMAAYSGRSEKMPEVKHRLQLIRVLARLNGANRSNLDAYFRLHRDGKPQPDGACCLPIDPNGTAKLPSNMRRRQ